MVIILLLGILAVLLFLCVSDAIPALTSKAPSSVGNRTEHSNREK
jgi:hypothetical protein